MATQCSTGTNALPVSVSVRCKSHWRRNCPRAIEYRDAMVAAGEIRRQQCKRRHSLDRSQCPHGFKESCVAGVQSFPLPVPSEESTTPQLADLEQKLASVVRIFLHDAVVAAGNPDVYSPNRLRNRKEYLASRPD